MNRMTRGTVVLAAALGVLSCQGDPTGDLRNGVDHLIATPTALFIGENTSQTVIVEAVDEQGNRLGATFRITAPGTGIDVAEDLTFNRVFNNKGQLVQQKNPTRVRYNVTGLANTATTSFEISAGGKSITIPVRIIPAVLPNPTLSNATPAIGDTVSFTLPAPYIFTSASVVTYPGAPAVANPQVTSVSADGSTIFFVPVPGITARVDSISNVVLSYAPAAAAFKVSSGAALTTPPVPDLTFAPTNAVAGDTITVTAPGAFRFTPTSAATVTGAGNAKVDVSADSTQLRFLIGPSANGPVSVSNMRISGAPALGPFALNSGATDLTTPAITNFSATLSSAAPAIDDTVTMTVAAGFRLLPTSTVTIGGQRAFIVSRSTDSLSISFVPSPGGAAAPPTVNGIALSFLTGVPLNLPANTNLTPPAIGAGLAGTGAFATAPTITFPASGSSVVFHDFGTFSNVAECLNDLGGPCRIYKVVLAAQTTFTLRLEWEGTTDIGVYWYDDTQTFLTGGCDALGNGAGGQPETCTKTFPAGTYYLVSDDFGGFYNPVEAAPTWQRFGITVN